MCWLGDWIRLIHPMHWFQSLLRSSRRLKPQISHGFLAPFEGFPDASPSVLQVWENVGIQVIMGLSTGLCRIYGKTWDTGDHLSTLPYISVRCHATGHLVASLTGSTNGQIHLVTWDKVLFQGTSNIMCWLGDWIRLIHPM